MNFGRARKLRACIHVEIAMILARAIRIVMNMSLGFAKKKRHIADTVKIIFHRA